MTFTGLCNEKRFFVDATDPVEARVKVRQAHALVHGQAAAQALQINTIQPYRHIWWA